MSLFDRWRRTTEPASLPKVSPELARRFDSLSSLGSFTWQGIGYPGGFQTTWTPEKAEPIGNNFAGYAQVQASNGPIFALIETRRSVLSEVRFQWQQINAGKPGRLFGSKDLAMLERPWVNATTGDLVSRLEVFDSLGGNAYVIRRKGQLKVVRPDWVSIVVASETGDPHELDSKPRGYIYWPGGPGSGAKPVTLLPSEVAHYAPTPDPLALYRGMSWITPVVREIQADQSATSHKLKFFENAATPNLAVSLDKAITAEQFAEFVDLMDAAHNGVENAYKTLYLAGGADVTTVGADLRQLDFAVTQGAGETRLAAAAGVPAIIAGFKEGLESATYSNFGQARRAFSDKFLRSHWRAMAGALESIVPLPGNADPSTVRLWYDATDVSFLQEDERDAADIAAQNAVTIRQLTDAGYTPDSVVPAVMSGDLSGLVHSGLYSVQLQTPGADHPAPPTV